jgi:hypothetical protein
MLDRWMRVGVLLARSATWDVLVLCGGGWFRQPPSGVDEARADVQSIAIAAWRKAVTL